MLARDGRDSRPSLHLREDLAEVNGLDLHARRLAVRKRGDAEAES
jgi:hypothetical protein